MDATGSMKRQRGFTYLWLLVAIAILGIGLLAVSEVWVSSVRRQKTEQLNWVGGQFVTAIGSYYQSTPGAVKTYPVTLQDLVEDRRFPTMRRHLRSIYLNPVTGKMDWKLVLAPDGRIRGVQTTALRPVGGASAEFVYQPQIP
jgi:type II secretory pathway pseudopilin PulG